MRRQATELPAMAKGLIAFSGALFAHRTLPRRLVERVRLRVAFHHQCRSCMAIRYRTAVDDGMTEGVVCSLERPQDAPDLTVAEKAVAEVAAGIDGDGMVRRAKERSGPRQPDPVHGVPQFLGVPQVLALSGI